MNLLNSKQQIIEKSFSEKFKFLSEKVTNIQT